MTESTESLFGMLAGTPRLDGAACIGRSALFDPQPADMPEGAVIEAQETALAICAGCPVLRPCRVWFGSLPRRHRPKRGRGAREVRILIGGE
jgi:WhiB family redox-sensing transcriptional regulator